MEEIKIQMHVTQLIDFLVQNTNIEVVELVIRQDTPLWNMHSAISKDSFRFTHIAPTTTTIAVSEIVVLGGVTVEHEGRSYKF